MKTSEGVKLGFNGVCSLIAINDLNNIINLLLLIVSIVSVVLTICFKIYDRLKDGKVTKEEIEDTIEDIKEGVEEIDKKINNK